MKPGDWKGLTSALLSARSVTVVGILPPMIVRCALDALTSDAKRGQDDGERSVPTITYVTPIPDIDPPSTSSGPAAQYQRQWMAGFKGMTRLLAALAEPKQPRGRRIVGLPFMSCDCLLLLEQPEPETEPEIRLLTHLATSDDSIEEGHILDAYIRDRDNEVSQWIHSRRRRAGPVVIREVVCRELDTAVNLSRSVTLPQLEVVGLPEYQFQAAHKGFLEPIAIVVPRYLDGDEPGVLLHKRDRESSDDDFDRWSLLSARVMEEDHARALDIDTSSPSLKGVSVLEDLCERAESHSRNGHLLTKNAFIYAAQRAVALNLNLSVEAKRLKFQGFKVEYHEITGQQLGFAVFTLDLGKSRGRSELSLAKKRNPTGLKPYQVKTLYRNGAELNRLLLNQREWLERKVLVRRRPAQRQAGG